MADSHALRTRAPLTPKGSFDLHVLGMPPAFVLSQDQTLKLCHDHQRHRAKTPPTANNRTPGADYLHLSNVMDTKDMQNNRPDFQLRHRARSSQDADAVAHMSLHLKQQCQRTGPLQWRRPCRFGYRTAVGSAHLV